MMNLITNAASVIAIFMICVLSTNCVSKDRRQSQRKNPSKIAAVTRLKGISDIKNFSKKESSSIPFCYIDQNKKVYFINARKYQDPTQFLNKYIDEFKVFSEADIHEFSRHPTLKEAYCGHIHLRQKAQKKKLYFDLELEEATSARKVATIYQSLRNRINVANSDGKLSFFYKDPDLHRSHHRNFKAMGIPISHVSSVSKKLISKKKKESQAEHIDINLTEIDTVLDSILQTDRPAVSKVYGHLANHSEQGKIATLVPFALHDYFMRSKLKNRNCEQARSTCVETFGNSCQYAHGICLSSLIKYKNARLIDLIKQLFSEKRKESYANNDSLKQATLGFIREIQKTLDIDTNFLKKVKKTLTENYKGSQLLRVLPSYNFETSKAYDLPLNFLGEYACLKDEEKEGPTVNSEFSKCLDESSRSDLAQILESLNENLSPEEQTNLYKLSQGKLKTANAIKEIFLSIYSPEVYDLFEEKGVTLENLRVAFRINRVMINVSHHGYAFIYPSAKDRSFKMKIVDYPFHPWKKDLLKKEDQFNEIYLSISLDNRVSSFTQRSSNSDIKPFRESEVEQVVMGIKRKYLEKLSTKKESDNRLYSFRYTLTHDGELDLKQD